MYAYYSIGTNTMLVHIRNIKIKNQNIVGWQKSFLDHHRDLASFSPPPLLAVTVDFDADITVAALLTVVDD